MSNRWQATKIPGIRKDTRSGTFYINKHVNGRYCGESLGTTNFEAAKAKFYKRLGELSAEPRTLTPKAPPQKLSFSALAETYLARIGAGVGDLDRKTIDKKSWVFKTLRRTWSKTPGLPADARDFDQLSAKRITFDMLLAWRKYFLSPTAEDDDYNEEEAPGAGLSPDYFNACLRFVQRVLTLAIEHGQCRENPALRVDAAKVQKEEYILPTADEFQRILSFIGDGYKNHFTAHARDLIEGLALTGLRISEARALRVEHVDLDANEIRLPAVAVKGVKGRKQGRVIDLLPEAVPLFTRLVANAVDGRIFAVHDATQTLKRAAKRAGWKGKMSLHVLRHAFASRCLEAGVDVRTVAGWLGHRDGGKLLLTTYAHLCRAHGKESAKKVRFFSKAA